MSVERNPGESFEKSRPLATNKGKILKEGSPLLSPAKGSSSPEVETSTSDPERFISVGKPVPERGRLLALATREEVVESNIKWVEKRLKEDPDFPIELINSRLAMKDSVSSWSKF